jgi:hypothetical protein
MNREGNDMERWSSQIPERSPYVDNRHSKLSLLTEAGRTDRRLEENHQVEMRKCCEPWRRTLPGLLRSTTVKPSTDRQTGGRAAKPAPSVHGRGCAS